MRSRPDILADARWVGPHGIGRFAQETLARLPAHATVPADLPLLHPLEPLRLHWLLRRMRPRVYYTPGFNPPLASPVPLVMTVFDLIHLRIPEESSPAKRAFYTGVVRPAARRARILTTSEFSKQEILDWAGIPAARVTVVGCGAAAGFRPEGPRHEPGYPYFLHVGNHKPHKNLPRLFAALARLPRDLAPVHLLLTGELDSELRSEARRSGVHDRVHGLGTVPEPDLPRYYRGARALVIPSLYEGFGLPAIEAMACGTPVLAAGTTALREVVGTDAVLVEPRDIDSIAAGMQRLLEDTELGGRLAGAGPVRARAHSWEEVAARVRTVLADAAGAATAVAAT